MFKVGDKVKTKCPNDLSYVYRIYGVHYNYTPKLYGLQGTIISIFKDQFLVKIYNQGTCLYEEFYFCKEELMKLNKTNHLPGWF